MQQIPESVKNKLIKVSSSVFELLKRSKQQLTSSLKTQNDTIHTTVKEHKDEISTGLGCGATIAGMLISLDIIITLAGESDDATDLFLSIIAGIYSIFAVVLLAKGIIGEKEA